MIGLEIGTTSKHFRKLRDVHEFMLKEVPTVQALPFGDFIMPDIKEERAARSAYTVEQVRELFVLLLVWYTGMRREEVCKLLIADVEEYAGIWRLNIRFTEAGSVKNTSSVRLVALSDEVIRLGFVKYNAAIKAAGHDSLFPSSFQSGQAPRRGTPSASCGESI